MHSSERAFVIAAAAFLAAALAMTGGCSAIPEFGELTVEETYAVGAGAAARGDHLLAIEALSRVLSTAPLHELADDALLALGDSHRAVRDFSMAEGEYRRLAADYPTSPLVAEAAYKLGVAYYDQSLPSSLDQSMTERAIDQFSRFVESHPESPLAAEARAKVLELRSRLAEKAYEAALLYFKLKSAPSARVYLAAVARDYADTPWAPKALLAQARSLAGEGMTAEAQDVYGKLVELYPGTDEAAAAALDAAGP